MIAHTTTQVDAAELDRLRSQTPKGELHIR